MISPPGNGRGWRSPAREWSTYTGSALAAKEACIDLTGHIRLAWYRDPKGVASSQEVAVLRAAARISNACR